MSSSMSLTHRYAWQTNTVICYTSPPNEAFALCHFLPARRLADTPAVRCARPPTGLQGPCGRSIFRTKGEYTVAAASRRKPGASRAVAAGSQLQGGGRTTAAVIPCRAARPGQPATALTFRPQAAKRHCHHRHEAEPQAPACRERSVSPCGKRCRPGYSSAPGWNGGCSPASTKGCPKGSA